VIVSVAALAGLGALAFMGTRIAGAFGQLQAVAPAQTARGPSLPVGGASAAPPRRDEAAALAPETAEVAAPAASGGDEHILRALAADPEFARAADELLNDPDPQTRAEARVLLRDLGVP
jgi:hypothetical protein